MWISKSEPGWYTVYYCPRCKQQRVWNTIRTSIFKCGCCGLLVRYVAREGRLSMDLRGM